MVLIGHRGVGKSHLLERLKSYFNKPGQNIQGLQFYDLDKEIEFREGQPISDIFNDRGEDAFRKLEVAVFNEILKNQKNFIVAVGAGFNLATIPKEIEKIWVRRKTDALGRIFLNRPRLNPELSPLEEYLKRLPLREESYFRHSDWQYIMPEGIEGSHPVEEKIFQHSMDSLGGILTLLPKHFENEQRLQFVLRSYDVEYFELRDDLLSIAQIQLACSLLPNRRILMSLRKSQTHVWLQEFLKMGATWDWASELGPCSVKALHAPILSVHQLPKDSLQSLDNLKINLHKIIQGMVSHIKLAPIVSSFKELEVLYSWQCEDPAHRSILPRSSENGTWNWFRLFMKYRQRLNFFRTDQGSALDQPTLFEWFSVQDQVTDFAAVLGEPVFHSRTPLEHESFFQRKQMPVFAIEAKGVEFNLAFHFLEKIGLKAAAVTSPLKNFAFDLTPYRSALANDLGSVNTLVKKGQVWYSHNTDLDGFRALFSQITSQESHLIAAWGGGGTLSVIRKIIPRIWIFSVRNQSLRQEMDDLVPRSGAERERVLKNGPEVLIWAAAPDAAFPPEHWQPKVILDLNYREDSLAREYALMVKAQYIDGLIMFKEQAKAQRDYWERN
jgi:shikimate 5-dehydrogenase/shikimate kinase